MGRETKEEQVSNAIDEAYAKYSAAAQGDKEKNDPDNSRFELTVSANMEDELFERLENRLFELFPEGWRAHEAIVNRPGTENVKWYPTPVVVYTIPTSEAFTIGSHMKNLMTELAEGTDLVYLAWLGSFTGQYYLAPEEATEEPEETTE